MSEERNLAGRTMQLFEVQPPVVTRVHAVPPRARNLSLDRVEPAVARLYVAAWHSRLPTTQRGPWRLAFTASFEQDVYASALWHNPSARGLPQDWLELRRLACAPDAPHCTASWMLGAMARWIRATWPNVPRLISYQDTEVHRGIIYKAAGWTPAAISKARVRNRANARHGTTRAYRSDLNGQNPAGSAKVRWEMEL